MAWPRTYEEAIQQLGSEVSIDVRTPGGLVGSLERDDDGLISITGSAIVAVEPDHPDSASLVSIEIRGDLLIIMFRADGVVFASITDDASDPEIVAEYERIQSCYPTWAEMDNGNNDGMTLIVALGPWELDDERTRAVVAAVFEDERDLATAVAKVVEANGSNLGIVERGVTLSEEQPGRVHPESQAEQSGGGAPNPSEARTIWTAEELAARLALDEVRSEYAELLARLHSIVRSGPLDEILQISSEAIELLPKLAAAQRKAGPPRLVARCRAVEALARYAPIRRDRPRLTRASAALANHTELADLRKQITGALEQVPLVESFLAAVRSEPGIAQSAMAKRLGTDRSLLISIGPDLQRDGQIVRVKSGTTFALFLPSNVPR
jgi:hypothetical protein